MKGETRVLDIQDVLIIGGGPCGLAVAARLHESTPSALFTDSEHQRMKSSASSRRNSKLTRTTRRNNTRQDRLLQGDSSVSDVTGIGLAVLDAHGDRFMSAWDSKFAELQITHLRSPMFFHPDPRDRDGLLGWVYKNGRERELREIKGVIGKGLSKYQRKQAMKQRPSALPQETSYLDERFRPDYYRPSQAIFKAYCGDIVERYNLSKVVHQSKVNSISYDSDSKLFTLQTSTGLRKARIVIMAAGAALEPTLPPGCPFCGLEKTGSVTHAFTKYSSLSINALPAHIQRKIRENQPTNVVVVGGGLTSAQVTATLSQAGVSKVYHLMRGNLKVKHFDIDLPWVGKYKNFHLASFYGSDSDQERFEKIRDARGGGSITPEYKKILCELIRTKKLELKQNVIIQSASWDGEAKCWELATEPRVELPPIDHVVYATGVAADFKTIPALQPLLEQYEMKIVGGMPCLTDDLMWNEEMPFFVTGRLAGLRLGPAAGNLEGARQGAERIAWKIGELFREWKAGGDAASGYHSGLDPEEVDVRRLGLGIENQFEVLGLNEEVEC